MIRPLCSIIVIKYYRAEIRRDTRYYKVSEAKEGYKMGITSPYLFDCGCRRVICRLAGKVWQDEVLLM